MSRCIAQSRMLCFALLLAAVPGAWAARPAVKSSAIAWYNQALVQARKGHLDQAFLLAQKAAQGQSPTSRYIALRENLRQRATVAHLQRAHSLMLADQPELAADEFREALAIDPGNPDGREGLAAAFPRTPAPAAKPAVLRVQQAAPPVTLQPAAGVHSFHVRAPLRQVVAQVADAYGLHAYVANSVPNTALDFDVGKATFAEAMTALGGAAGVAWIPLDPHTLYFTDAGRLHQIEPVAARTFYIPGSPDSLALNQMLAVLKSLLGIQDASADAATSAITIRATPAQLDAAERLLLDFGHSPGEVVLDVKLLDVTATGAQELGLGEPNQFTLFALGPLLSQLSATNAIEQEILQIYEQSGVEGLLASGLLSSSALSTLESTLSPLLSSGFVTFGGGATLMAVSVPNATANASITNSMVHTVESALLRANSGQTADLKVGQSYPIVTSEYSSGEAVNSAISSLIGSVAATPMVQYEDLGLDAKLTPVVNPDGEIDLSADIGITGLAGESNNDIPILDNRHVITDVSMRDNDPVLIGGLITKQEMLSIAGLPGLSYIPLLGSLFSTATTEPSSEQMVLMITPHIVRLPPTASPDTWLPASFAAASNEPLSEAAPNGRGLIAPAPSTGSTRPPTPNPNPFLQQPANPTQSPTTPAAPPANTMGSGSSFGFGTSSQP